MDRAMILFPLALMLAACGAEAPDALPETAPAAEATTQEAPAAPASPTIYGYEVVATYPHGANDFTQGFFVADGVLYESTGRVGQSALIRHDLLGEAEEARQALPGHVFGEGATAVGDRIVSLTWRNGIGYVHDLATLEPVGEFDLPGEGWGLTTDGERLILSDGTNRLKFLDPETFEVTGNVAVTANGKPVPRLNELEYIDGEVWANVWMTDVIVIIDPEDGDVTGFVDLSGLYADNRDPRDNVLNGIAHDPDSDRLFVTGKNWPQIYEIKLAPRD